MRKFIHVEVQPFGPVDPAEACQIRDCHAVTNQPRSVVFSTALVLLQSIFHHRIESLCFRQVPIDGIRNLLWSVKGKVVCLTLTQSDPRHSLKEYIRETDLHWSNAAMLPFQEAHDLPVLARVVRIGDLMVGIISLGQVQQDGSAFKDALLLRLAVRPRGVIDDGRDATIGYHRQLRRRRFGDVAGAIHTVDA